MAYRQPGVTVTQEFQNAAAALAAFSLPSVTVGPAFQVLSKQVSATPYAAVLVATGYPNQLAGSIVDIRPSDTADLINYPVRIFLQNAIARILPVVVTGEVLIGNLNQFTDATVGVFANVVAGDVIVVTGSGSGNNGSFTVREKVSANVLTINETFTAAEAALSYTVRRNVGELEIPVATVGVVVALADVTLPAGLTTTITGFGAVPILSAAIALTYRALRFEQSADVVEYTTTAELQAFYGTDQIVPENPVVFGTFLALQNSATATNLLALPRDFLDTGGGSGDELLAYANAFDVLALTDMYAIAILTQNTSVHTSLKSHVATYSEPAQKKERVGIANRKIVLTSVVLATKTDGATATVTLGLKLTSATAAFITSGVVPGHFVSISLPAPQAGRYKIASVDSQTQVTLTTAVPPGTTVTGITFVVDKDLTKSEQAEVLKAYAQALGSRRFVLTWPDVVSLPVGNAIRPLPGYFLNCAVAALTTGLPTQQGLTNLTMAVYTGVTHSTKYFTDAQLNTIADGGVMIFVQAVLDVTPLFVRHQLTTDRSAVKFQEYSVTKNVDFISKFLRENHASYIGQYNIVDTTFDDLKTRAKGIISFLRDSTIRPKIGGVIRSGELKEIRQDDVNIDAIIERYGFSIPIPLNNLDITVVV